MAISVTNRDGSTTVVSMLTAHDDGSITLRLHPKGSGVRSVVLIEPTAREYGDLRKKMREADSLVEEKFPLPAAPSVVDPPSDLPEGERDAALEVNRLRMVEYTEALGNYSRDRVDYLRDPDQGPYAQVIIEVARVLGGREITLDDLPRGESDDDHACVALLETWEAPLGGPAATPPAPTAAPPIDAPPAPASPESAPSSPPGTEPASPSLPPSSTA